LRAAPRAGHLARPIARLRHRRDHRPAGGSAAQAIHWRCPAPTSPSPATPDPPIPPRPQPHDLAIGPLIIVNGKRLATADPAGYGEHGSYKIPLVLLPGRTATVTIGAQARGRVVIDNPYSPVGGVAAASYHACPHATGFFAQGFAFTDGRARGCVPLDVRIGNERGIRHVTLSLFAGSCPS
jgi:hypothetical protein